MKIPTLLLLSLCVAVVARAGLQTDIEYGLADGESLKLDAYVPDGAGPFPAVILVHGGGWNGGDKSGGPQKGYMAPMQEPLQRAGFAWFSINYRLTPKHPYPACIEDVETAIRWVKSHAAEYHLDPQRIALSGESAGGHLVALAAVQMKDDTRLAAIVPFYGLFDMTQRVKPGELLDSTMARLFASAVADEKTMAVARAASPLFAVKAGLPPFLLVHGSVDQSVPYQQSVEMQQRLRAVGVPCDLMTIEGGVHGMLYWDKVAPDYKDRVIAWLEKTLGVAAR
jgi:alpha-L-fucosidase 2